MKLSKELKVGLFMAISITLLYFGFNFLKGIDFFSTSNKYFVIYENVNKLTESNQVFLNGTAVGRVSKVQIQQQKNRVLVELDIDSEIVLTDSTIALLSGELLGGPFIQLNVKPGRRIEAKDTIRSEVAKGVLDFAGPVATNMQTTLANLNTILEALARNTARLDTIFIRLQTTPALLNKTLSSANSNIDQLGITFRDVAANLNGTLTELKPTLSNFKTLSDSLKMIQLNGTINKAQQSLAKLNETLSQLSKGDNTASKLLTEDSLYVNLNKLLQSVDSLADHFNKNPKHFLAPLGKSQKKIERDLKKKNGEPKQNGAEAKKN
jgi:phospholipid/cholesterol/gamma-HCH transport system substrate-binding protein